ncbi:MAG: UTRA domain-containing protein [Pseudomonadota bacterium]
MDSPAHKTFEPEAHWRDIAGALRAKIEDRSLLPGTRLPSLEKLASQSGTSIHQARKAIDQLKRSGHVTGWRGKGNFVSEDTFVYRLSARTRFNANLSVEGKETTLKMVGRMRKSAPDHVAKAFGLRIGAQVQRAEFVRVVEDRPAILARHYYPLSPRFQSILDLIGHHGSVTVALAQCGISDFLRRETSISARLPTAHEALILEIPRTQPVLTTIGVNVGDGDCVVEVSEAVCRSDRVTFKA